MNLEQPVLIVGSGPTGMIMASQLATLGIPVRLIDRLAGPVTTSRAFTIHARTLELLGQMNLAQAFLDQGIKTYSMDYHFPGKEDTPKLDFTELDSVYPFCLTINQVDTETILRQHLTAQGVQIEWQTELVSFAQNDEASITVTLNHLDTSQTETMTVQWLIGCDGIRSVVREQLALPFDGSEYAGTMRMIDAPLSGFTETDTAVHYFVAKDHMLLINKLPGRNHRILISDKTEGVPPEQAQTAFQEVANKHFGGSVQIGEPVWATNFRISRRKTNSYRQGQIFLAGDAAHVNSPAGGQGMNVAMQDAFNLSWKLALVLQGKAPVSLLDSYEAERSPVASQMLEGTNYIHSIIMAHGKGMQERIERMQGGEWNKEAVNQVAGISYTYRDPEDDNPGLVIGDRAPDASLSEEQRIYDLVAAQGYTVFLFMHETAQVATIAETMTALQEKYPALITPYLVVDASLAEQVPQTAVSLIVDSGEFGRRYESLDRSKLVVVRPDCHIAYQTTAVDINQLESFLKTVLH